MQSDLGRAMTPTLAYDAYVAFHHLMGRAALDAAIPNHDLIKALCSGFDEKDAIRPATFAHFRLVRSWSKIVLLSKLVCNLCVKLVQCM